MSLQALVKQKVGAFKTAKARNLNNPEALKAIVEKDVAYFQIAGEVLEAAGAEASLTLVEKVMDLLEAEGKVIDQQLALESELTDEADAAE